MMENRLFTVSPLNLILSRIPIHTQYLVVVLAFSYFLLFLCFCQNSFVVLAGIHPHHSIVVSHCTIMVVTVLVQLSSALESSHIIFIQTTQININSFQLSRIIKHT